MQSTKRRAKSSRHHRRHGDSHAINQDAATFGEDVENVLRDSAKLFRRQPPGQRLDSKANPQTIKGQAAPARENDAVLVEVPVPLEIHFMLPGRHNPSSELSALVHFDFTGGEERIIHLVGPTIATD